MKTISFGKSGLQVPTLALGCMRLSRLSDSEVERYVRRALDLGANFFDHADIYGGGKCEEIFGRAVAGVPRGRLLIQSKCAHRAGQVLRLSKEHILGSVDGIPKGLNTIRRAAVLSRRADGAGGGGRDVCCLKASDKVLHFGVSNQNSM